MQDFPDMKCSANVRSTRIAGLGHYVPERRIENSVLEQDLGLSNGWIARRTGIKARRWAAPDQALTDIAVEAASSALARAQNAGEVGLVLLATSTPDHLLPPSAPLLAHRLGFTCGAIDLTGACSGFVYALLFADGFVRTTGQSVLIVAANILSRRINRADTTSAVLFADAAGAMVLAPSSREGAGLLGSSVMSDGSLYDMIAIKAGGTRNPDLSVADPEDRVIRIKDGKVVFEKAVKTMTLCSVQALERAGIQASQIDHFIPHQANARIFDLVAENLKLDPSRTLRSIEEFGNSSAATIPLTLSLAAQDGKLADGQFLLMAAVGAGFTGGAAVFRTSDQ
ncbi:MAG: beta-ketoacyl-ACP synthase III [Afipia felis]|nr:beta-ketoacyl-ACP synthase III [Afipia felis]